MGIRGIPHIGPDQFSRLLDTNRQTNTKTNKKQTSKFVFRQINSIQVLSISKKNSSTAYLTHLRSIVCFINTSSTHFNESTFLYFILPRFYARFLSIVNIIFRLGSSITSIKMFMKTENEPSQNYLLLTSQGYRKITFLNLVSFFHSFLMVVYCIM